MVKTILISALHNGFGFGITPEKEKVFFHSSNFGMKSFSDLKVGDSFLAITENGQKGLTAIPIVSCEVYQNSYQLGVYVHYLTKENNKRRDSFLNYAIHGEKLDRVIPEEVRVAFFSKIAEEARVRKEAEGHWQTLLDEFQKRVDEVGVKPYHSTGCSATWYITEGQEEVISYDYRWWKDIKEEIEANGGDYSMKGFYDSFHFFSYTKVVAPMKRVYIEIVGNEIREESTLTSWVTYKITERVAIPFVKTVTEEKVDNCFISGSDSYEESSDGYRSGGGSYKWTYEGPGFLVTETETAPDTFEYKGTIIVVPENWRVFQESWYRKPREGEQ